ncbi:MAG: hypothetical protein HY298_04310 [Verrucomicrobia bacterium]|nr:hypothetical protein [Verrucomicrobiota bacterium]
MFRRARRKEGAELVALYLMESPRFDNFKTTFPLKGNDTVEKVQYTDDDKRVWINAWQLFGGVSKAVWEFHLRGHQVCEKWLKVRRGRKCVYADCQHFQQIIVALNETIRFPEEIDDAIEKSGGRPMKSGH